MNQNNITNITNNNDNNNLNDVAQTNEFNDVNFTFQQEATEARNTAMENHIAGIPIINPTITLPKEKPDLDKVDITSSFTIRDQIMSNLGLMDENYNYTDTYTNYISHGGTPLPGYEYAHQELLNQERYDQIFQKVEDGHLSYDTALLEAYGKDILATSFGIDVTSVAYWQNKFLKNDFSNPFTNRYLMDQVRSAAESYHQQRLTGQYAKTNVKDSTLNSLIGQELDEKLSASKIQELFNMDQLKDNLDDEAFFRALHNGQIAANMRLIPVEGSNAYYYLHTDGELYILDGQKGENHGTLHLDKDGNFEGIDLNNSGVVSFTRSTWTGLTSIFQGIFDLGLIAAKTIASIIPIGENNFWDGFDSEDFFEWSNGFDGWLQDDAAWLVDSGYIDLSEKISVQDVFNFTGSMIGTIAGTMTLAGISGLLANAGTSMQAAHPVAGSILKGTGTLLKWQTGNIGTNAGGYGHIVAFSKEGWKDVGRRWATGANLQVWGRRVGAAGVANTKNFLNDYRKNAMKANLYENGASNSEILKASLVTMAINTGIDSFISGGIDDNQFQAYFGTDSVFSNKEQKILSKKIAEYMTKGTSKTLYQELEKNASGSLKKYLRGRAFVIGFNSVADFGGNMLTGAIQYTSALDDKGQVNGWKNFSKAFSPELFARSAMNTLWYSTRGQIKDWNAGLETIGRAHTDLMDRFKLEIANAKGNPAKQKALVEVRNKYIEDLNSAKGAATYEGKIIYAMDKLNEGLKKEGEDVAEILKTSISKVATEAQRQRLSDIYTNAELIYAAKLKRIETMSNPVKAPTKLFRWLSGISGSDKALKQEEGKNANFQKTLESMSKVICSTEYTKSIEEAEKVIQNKIDPEVLQSKTGYSLYKENKDLFEKLQAQDPYAAEKLYLYLPNEGDRDNSYRAHEIALDISESLGYLRKAKIEGEVVYEIQPYFDQIDYYNSSVVNSLIHKSILALTTEAKLEEKAQIVENLSKGLMDNNISDVTKTTVISSILNKLSVPKSKDDSAVFMKGDEAAKIILELQSKGYLTKVDLSKIKDVKGNESATYLATAGDILLKLQKDKGHLIDLTDPVVQEVLENWKKTNTITKEQYDSLMRIKDENPESFQNGSLLNKQRFIENQIKNTFKDMLPIHSNLNVSEEGIELWLKELGKTDKTLDDKKKDQLYKDIMAFAKEYDNIYKNGKTVTIDNGDNVYVDLEKFQGKSTAEFAKRILTIGYPTIRNIGSSKEYKEFETGLYKDMTTMNKYKKINGSLIKFDLRTNPNAFITFMKDFGYTVEGNSAEELKSSIQKIRGLYNYTGENIVLNIPQVKNIKYLKEALTEDGYFMVGNKRYYINTKTYEDANGNKLQKVDIDRAVLDQIEVKNIDPRLNISLKHAPLLQLIPFEQPIDSKYNYTMPINVALLGDVEALRKLSGKMAGQTGRSLSYLFKKSAGAKVSFDTKLENYFTLHLIVDHMFENPEHMNIRIANSEAKYLKDNGLVDYMDKGKHINKDTLWEMVGRGSNNTYSVKLKQGITKEKVLEYIVSKNFNVHKLIPFKFSELKEQGGQGIIDAFATYTTEGTQQLLPGLARETALSILNIRLPWDDGDNSRYAKFLNDLINSEATYNPLEGADFTAHKDIEDKSFDDWYARAKTSKDPLDIIAKRYVDTYNDMVHGEEGQEKYDNYTLLIANPASRKALLKVISQNATEATPELVSEIKKAFAPYTGNYYEKQSISAIPNAIVGKGEPVDNATYINESRTSSALGGYKNIEVTADFDWIDMATVQEAIDYIIPIVNTENNIFRTSFYDNYIITKFEEDDVVKLFKGAAGSDGYIPIEDVDEYANILAENYKEFMDGREEYRIKESLIPSLKEMYGSNYESAVKTIFNQAKKHQRLASKQFEVMNKHVVSYSSPSIENNGYYTLDYAPTYKDDELVPTEIGRNFGTMLNYVENNLKNKAQDSSEYFDKLMTTSSELLDNDLYDALQKDIMEDKYLYTSAPYATDVEKYSESHNALGMMITSINTWEKLKQTFPDAKPEDLMHLATTLTNLHSGVEYVGNTARFVIVKNGSLFDGDIDLMDKYASENYNDLLFNIHKARKDLEGCAIIRTESQPLDDVTGLKMSYKTIDSDETFDDLVTDLYRNFIIDNSYYLTRDSKDIKDVEQLQQEIFGGSIDASRIQDLLNRIPSERISTRLRNKKLYDVFRDRAEVAHLSKGDFFAMINDIDTITANTIARENISNSLNIDEDYKSNRAISSILNLTFGIGNVDYIRPEARKLIEDLKVKLLVNSFNLENENTYVKQGVDFVLKNIVDREDAPSIDLLARNRSLVEMMEETKSGNIKNAFTINTDNGNTLRVDSQEILNLAKSLESNDSTIETDYVRTVALDTETGIVHDQLDYDKSIFALGLVVKTKNEAGWDKKRYRIFVNYESENMTESQRTKFRESWIKENVDTNNSFYKDNLGYRNDIETYKNIYENLSEDVLYLTPSEIKKFMLDLTDMQGKVALLGYNTSEADIPWMKFGNLIDNDILSKYTHIDVKVLGDTSQAIQTKNSGKQTVRAESYGLSTESAHSSIYDADVTTDLFSKIARTTFNVSSIRNFIYRDIQKSLESSNIYKYLNDEQVKQIYKKVDDLLNKSRNPKLSEYFDVNKQITTDSITC